MKTKGARLYAEGLRQKASSVNVISTEWHALRGKLEMFLCCAMSAVLTAIKALAVAKCSNTTVAAKIDQLQAIFKTLVA